jgi:TetR/AcrR family transcriptional repressor of nem operon
MTQKSEQKQKSRDAILASAAALLRARGIESSSVMDVMKGAGLTVGGFYGHFESKEQLFAATIHNAASAMWNRLLSHAKGDSPRARALNIVEHYLSRKHRDTTDGGCVLPSVAPEIARAGEPYRGALGAELGAFVRSFGELLGPTPEHRERALGLIALMYGALSLSRTLAGTRLSDEFLNAAKALAERVLDE